MVTHVANCKTKWFW